MRDREILLGVTGGVAAYKAAALASSLVQHGAKVTAVLTPAAEYFIGAATFAALTGRRVVTRLFDEGEPLGAHITLARRADVLCVAPATADFLAKLAQGHADDLLSTLYLSFRGPVLLAPAMNCEMWEKPSVQRNVAQLRDDGCRFVGPDAGWLSCREQGPGRMAAPEAIFQHLASICDEFPARPPATE